MIQNGLQRLGLLNSAGYTRAEMPLDESCSLVAPNNTGKTSLINALQYVLIADGNRMNFGEHARDASRRFYFPSNASYVLAQLQQPDGEVVIGCVGKGHAHEYEYFAYKGPLNLDDFRTQDGAIVAQPQFKAHMAALGRTVHTYSPGDFSDGLYGRNRKRLEHEPNFNVFRLEHSAYTGVFQTVLARTLRLDRLTSGDVKRFLLEIFKHELTDAGIDFQAAWDRAFAQVNLDRAQFDAATRMREPVLVLGEDLSSLLALRGKILAHRPIIDDLLKRWNGGFKTERAALGLKQDELRTQLEQLADKRAELAVLRDRASQALQRLEEERQRETELAAAFALLESRAPLETRLEAAIAERDALVTLIGNAKGRSPDALRREIEEVQAHRRRAAAALASCEDNLYLQLAEAVGPATAAALARIALPDVLALPPEAFELDPATLRRAASAAVSGEQVSLPGLSIDAGSLPAAQPPASREALQLALQELDDRFARLDAERATVAELDTALVRRAELEAQIRGAEQQLARYDEYQELLARREAREERLQATLSDASDLDRRLARVQAEHGELRSQEDQVAQAIRALEADNSEIDRLRGSRKDVGPVFDTLAHLPHHAWVQALNIPLSDLPAALGAYLNDCNALHGLTASIRAGLGEVHAGGLTKFMGAAESGMEAEVQHMVNFVGALAQEAETLERAARQAVVDVSSALFDLRRSLDEMTFKMREFNKLISQRKLSDLDVFRLDLVEIPELVDAIDKLLATAKLADDGQSFLLFNQKDVLGDEDLNRAKAILIREGQQNNGLKLENLFRLEFKVAKHGQSVEAFEDLEESASLGTILMAKLVIGLAMLHLMRDKRSASQAVCYLDEAATLDPSNQRSLIETAREFGFALIFASPLPITTARYCIPIDTIHGKNQISRLRWQVIEPLDPIPA